MPVVSEGFAQSYRPFLYRVIALASDGCMGCIEKALYKHNNI